MASSRNSAPPDLQALIAGFFRQHFTAQTELWVGLSGGIDSVVLLHGLLPLQRSLGLRLIALHVNHGLSPHAAEWEAFARALCSRWRVPFETCHVSVPKTPEGIEAAARRLRYQVFARSVSGAIALAHHRDDQAETVLFNLLRGAGVAGAAAMRAYDEVRVDDRRLLVLRPLLHVGRREIESYAACHRLEWVVDESNADARYARNFLRHEILPRLRARFPGCDATLARAAAHFEEAEDLLGDLASLDAGSELGQELSIPRLRVLSPARARNLLREFLKRNGVAPPPAARLREMVRQVTQVSRPLAFELGTWALIAYRDQLSVQRADMPPTQPVAWRGEETVQWAGSLIRFVPTGGEGVSAARLGSEAHFRARGGGERFRPDCRRPHRSLKNLFQEAGIPPRLRPGLPLLWQGNELVWVPGIGVDCAYQCAPAEPGWRIEWERSSLPGRE